jgi:Rha family phage regulatory protein
MKYTKKEGKNMEETVYLTTNEVTMTSKELAEITGKRHDHVIRDIKVEIEKLQRDGIGAPIFGETSYSDAQGKKQPCYEFGKKGAMQLALKYDAVTRYKVIDKLEELEKRNSSQIDISNLSPELQMFNSIFKSLAQVELSNREVKQEIQDMRDVISLDSRSWRKDGHALIIKSAQKLGGNQYIEQLTKEVYKLIDARFGVNLNQRLTNKRRRMAEEGICKSKRDKLNKMDIIAEDKKLIEGYIAITKEMAIKYGAA